MNNTSFVSPKSIPKLCPVNLRVHGVYCPTANVQTMKQMTISKVLMRFKRILFLESKGPRIQESETHTGSSSYSQISAMADAAYSTFICSATGAC